MNNFNTTAALLALVSLGLGSAQKAGAPVTPVKTNPVKITASTQLVTETTEKGQTTEKLTDGSKALPGQTLQMSQNVQNVSQTNLGSVALVQAISNGVSYQSNHCNVPGVRTTFSADATRNDPKTGGLLNTGALTFSEKPMKTVTVKENGAEVKKTVPATPADYTALRWNLPNLKAGGSVSCQLRVKVK